MSRRISLIVLTLLAFAMFWSSSRQAGSQQETERKQALIIGYPNPAIIIGGSGTRYGGIIYVSVYPISSELRTKHGAGPIATGELTPSQRFVWQLPLGEYEVRFAMRTGSEMKTFILRDVLLRPEAPHSLIVEMNADAKTTIVGGDMSAQQMADNLQQLQKEVAALKREISDRK